MSGKAYMCKNRHGTYYARFIIPKLLQPHFNNKKEIRRTLQTDSRKLAVKRARIYRVEFESIVDQLMSKADNIKEKARRIVDDLFADKAKIAEQQTEHFAVQMRIEATKSSNDDLSKTQLITFIDLNSNPVTIDTGDHEQDARLYQMLNPAPNHEELARREKREEELHKAQLAAIAAQAPASFQPVPQPTSKTVSEHLDEYIAHKKTPGKKGTWSEGTARQKPNKLNVFRSIFGDKPTAALTREDMERYIDVAYKIPSHFENPNYKKYEGVTLDMVLNDAPEFESIDYDVRGAGTVEGDLKIVKAFLNWVAKYKDVALQIPLNALGNEIADIDHESAKCSFSDEQLKILFENDNSHSENYVKGFKKPISFWLPLIALYTGARLSEICQLHLTDIKLVKTLSSNAEHWCIDINEDDDKSLKTKYSARQIPIHKNLINAGLLKYVEHLKVKEEKRLFPGANRTQDQFSSQSRWFAYYNDNAGITDKKTSFHSFRHNFCTYLANHHIPEDLVVALSGHQFKSLAKTTYARNGKRDVGKLVEVIDSIDYGLNHPAWKIY
ncbi:MAG: site-specific integrase [Methylococcales bacterium]|nr:site-specific integrase [Methylococcales bacterium]